MAGVRPILLRIAVLAAACLGADGAAAGPFVLAGGATNASALYDFNGSAIDQVFDLHEGVTSAAIQIGPGSFQGATASGESQVTASFHESVIAVYGSASAESAAVSTFQTATGRGTFTGNVQFFVDTSDIYRIYGSFDSALTDGGTGFAKVRLNTPTPYEQVLFDGGSATLNFDDLIFLQAGSYVLTYQAQLDSVASGVEMGSGTLTYEAHLSTISAVPEPSSAALVGGIAVAAGYVRRRQGKRRGS